MNGDRSVTATDAQLTFMFATGLLTPRDEEGFAADCNGDANISAGDAQGVFMTALGTMSCADPVVSACEQMKTDLGKRCW